MGVCNCSMFCCMLLYVHSSIAIILMGKRELIALLNLSSWCLVMVERLFLAVPRGCLQFVIVVFPDHTHLLYLGIPAKWDSNQSPQLQRLARKSKFRLDQDILSKKQILKELNSLRWLDCTFVVRKPYRQVSRVEAHMIHTKMSSSALLVHWT